MVTPPLANTLAARLTLRVRELETQLLAAREEIDLLRHRLSTGETMKALASPRSPAPPPDRPAAVTRSPLWGALSLVLLLSLAMYTTGHWLLSREGSRVQDWFVLAHTALTFWAVGEWRGRAAVADRQEGGAP